MSHPLTQCALLLLIEAFPDALPLGQLTEQAAQRLAQAGNPQQAAEHDALHAELFALFAHQRIGARRAAYHLRWSLADLPCLSPLARAQLEQGMEQLTAVHHATLQLDPFGLELARRCDGSRNLQQLRDELVELMKQTPALMNMLPPAQHKQPQRLPALVEENIRGLLTLLARNGVLVS